MIIHTPGLGDEKKFSNPIPQQPKTIGLCKSCVILPLHSEVDPPIAPGDVQPLGCFPSADRKGQ